MIKTLYAIASKGLEDIIGKNEEYFEESIEKLLQKLSTEKENIKSKLKDLREDYTKIRLYRNSIGEIFKYLKTVDLETVKNEKLWKINHKYKVLTGIKILTSITLQNRDWRVLVPYPTTNEGWQALRLFLLQFFKEKIRVVDEDLKNTKKQIKDLNKKYSQIFQNLKEAEKEFSDGEIYTAQEIYEYVWNYIEHQLTRKQNCSKTLTELKYQAVKELYNYGKISIAVFRHLQDKFYSIPCILYLQTNEYCPEDRCKKCPLYCLTGKVCRNGDGIEGNIENNLHSGHLEEAASQIKAIRNIKIDCNEIVNKQTVDRLGLCKEAKNS